MSSAMYLTFHNLRRCRVAAIEGLILVVNLGVVIGVTRAVAAPITLTEPLVFSGSTYEPDNTPANIAPNSNSEMIPEEFRRQVVRYESREAPGTVVIDTPNAFLYYVLGNGRAIRSGIGVGREGFTWSGVRAIDRKTEWPDWIPPAEMIDRQPDLPRWMAGGPGNPLGARAMYLGGTLYRIHGTSEPTTIGQHVSSGCIRMLNDDVVDLFGRVPIGTRVVVLPDTGRRMASRIQNEPQLSGPRTPASIYGPSVAREPSAMSVFSPLSLY